MSKEKNADLIRQATQALKLKDIVLFECRLTQGTEPPEGTSPVLQQKRATQLVRERSTAEATFDDVLQVRVSLGLRLAYDVDSEAKVVFEIEADFVVDYECISELAIDAATAFSEINSVHIVWPFWRQHVFDMVARARLPQIEVPLLSGTRL